MPIPIPVGNATSAVSAGNVSAANATVAVNVSAVNASAHGAAAAQPGQALGEAAGKVLRGLGGGWLNYIILLLFVLVLLGSFPLLVILIRRGLEGILPQPRFKTPWLIYDPTENTFRYVVLYRIAPNIYADQDGQYVALARHQSTPATLDIPLERKVRKENGDKAMYGVKIGDVVLNTTSVDEVYFTLFGEKIGGISETAKLILLLKERGLINDITISPNMKIVLAPKKDEMAKYLAKTMGDLAADTMVDIAAMTGSRQEFQAWIRQLVELEKERMEAVTKQVNKMAAIAFIFMVIAGIVYGAMHLIR